MNILLVASKYLPEYTGAAHRLHNLYKDLRARRPDWTVQVVTAGIEQDERADYNFDEIPVHRIRSRAPTARTTIGRLAGESLDAVEALTYLRAANYDLIHTVGGGPIIAAAIRHARARNIPLLVELVTDGAVPDPGLPLLGRVRRPDLHRGAGIVAISKPLAERCRRRGYTRNVWLRPNPVDTQRFFPAHEARNELRAELTPFTKDDIVITAVAKFMPQKNQIFLLDVLARLEPQFKLLLAGPIVSKGPLARRDRGYFDRLREKAIALGLERRLHLVPEFVPSDQYFKASDVVAMPSLQEGLGTPLLEAQACGIPVMANREVEAFCDHLSDGETGLVRSLDADAWAEAARLARGLDRSLLDKRAHEILRHNSSAAVSERYASLLNHLVASGAYAELDVSAVLGSEVD